MVDIGKHVMYCAGRGYVVSSYDKAVSEERAGQRVANQMMMDQSARGEQNLQAALAQQRAQPLPQLLQPATLGQRIAVFLATPLVVLANAFQALQRLPVPLPAAVQQLFQGAAAALNQAAGQVMAFFFNTRKSRNEVDDEFRQQREMEEIATSDLFTKFKVNESNESTLGGGG